MLWCLCLSVNQGGRSWSVRTCREAALGVPSMSLACPALTYTHLLSRNGDFFIAVQASLVTDVAPDASILQRYHPNDSSAGFPQGPLHSTPGFYSALAQGNINSSHAWRLLPTQASLSPCMTVLAFWVVPLSTRPDADFVCYRGCWLPVPKFIPPFLSK